MHDAFAAATEDGAFEAVTEKVIFRIGELHLAVPVRHVREILDVQPMTPLPRAPHHVLGLIKVRGQSIATLDFAQKMGLGSLEMHESSRIIVLELGEEGKTVLAILTDGVDGVADPEEGEVQDIPAVGEHWADDVVEAIGHLGDKTVAMINMEAVFGREDFSFDTV